MKLKWPGRIGALWILWAVLTPPAPAAAEWFLDLYGGGALTGNRNVSVPSGSDLLDVRFDTSGAGGARGGYWFDDFEYLGFALDGMHYRPNVPSQTVRTNGDPAVTRLGNTDLGLTALGFNVMLRVPLVKTEGIPHGQLQPYFLVGPVLAIATADDTTNFGSPNHQSRTSSQAGFNVGAGLLWQFATHVGVFGEYRYVQSSTDFNFANSTKVQFDIRTHLLVGGISFRF